MSGAKVFTCAETIADLEAENKRLRHFLAMDRDDLGFAGKALGPAIEARLMPRTKLDENIKP
jgi:hypothetical protein